MTEFRSELASNAGVFEERALGQPCLERRLDEIDAVLREARETRRLPVIQNVAGSTFRPFDHAVWDTTVNGETMLHLDPEDRKRLSLLYTMVSDYQEQSPEENSGWATLQSLENSPGPVSDNLLAELTTTASRLYFPTQMQGVIAQQFPTYAREMGVAPNYGLLAVGATRADLVKAMISVPTCQPLLVDGRPFKLPRNREGRWLKREL